MKKDISKLSSCSCRNQNFIFPDDTLTASPANTAVDYEDVKQVLKELKTYMKVPKDAVKNVRVFDVEDLLFFLENAVGVFKI